MSPSAYCTACGKEIEPNAQFCLACGAPAIAARPVRRLRFASARVFVGTLVALLAIAAACAAFWFRSYLGPPAAIVGHWSGAVARIPPDAGPYANADNVDVTIGRIGRNGSLIGTIAIGSASAPLSGAIHGHHVSIVADFSPASVGAPPPKFVADGTLDGDTIETWTTFRIGTDEATGVFINEPVALLRGARPVTAQTAAPASAAPSPAAPAPDPSEVPALIQQYYGLWDAHRLVDAYALLSEHYRSQHPYGEWERMHDSVVHITVQTASTRDPMVVSVVVRATDRRGSGIVNSEFHGTWTAVKDADGLRLDQVALNQTK